jgi:hypothetical protein
MLFGLYNVLAVWPNEPILAVCVRCISCSTLVYRIEKCRVTGCHMAWRYRAASGDTLQGPRPRGTITINVRCVPYGLYDQGIPT